LYRPHRISAGAIVLEQSNVLLARYGAKNRTTFLVGPGGGVNTGESLPEAVIREVREETGLEVNPYPCRILLVEEFFSYRYRHIKIWLFCRLSGGKLRKTQKAKREGIIDVRWYSKADLKSEVVYPSILMSTNWSQFLNKTWESKYLGLYEANF
jgi:8-oxo-dGTP diphosphatase